MPVLGKTIVLRSCAVEQADRQISQLIKRDCNIETSLPHTFDPAAYHASTPPIQPLAEKITYTPSSPPTPTDPAPRLSLAAKAGIITACIVVFVLLFLLTLELAYLGRQRRARAVQQAQCAVDQGGVELDDVNCGREIKENVVLESRVEIVVGEEEEAPGSSVRGSWGKVWDVDGDTDGEVEVWGRERNGMSLQRRMH